MRLLVPLAALALVTACGASTATTPVSAGSALPAPVVTSAPPEASPSPSASASPSPSSSPSPAVPYFATPEAAMRYLADAWNRRDLVSLKHVTTPIGRESLEYMRQEAVDLRLTSCARNTDRQDYDCTFTHGFPVGYQGHPEDAGYARSEKSGTATFVVGPATRSGWYMTVLESCG